MGMITDIQRFTLNDGPGIRTTVFFKGCNMACTWCHNPETLSGAEALLIYPERCVGCGACVGFDAQEMAKSLPPKREALAPSAARACYAGALSVAGREMSIAQIMEQVGQDALYYQNSGGGVTLSGGEALMQSAFAKEVLQACRAQGIATAVETNLCYGWEVLEGLLPLLDLVMADVKLLDAQEHLAATGVSNERIRENAQRLAKTGTPYIVRTPVVPGVNATQTQIGAIAGFVASLGGHLLYYELLNYNPLGASKYEGLGADNLHGAARPLAHEAMQAMQATAQRAGLTVRIG